MFIKSSYKHSHESSWSKSILENSFPGTESIKFFDQSGYALCTLELMYANANNSYVNANREKQGIYMPWIKLDNKNTTRWCFFLKTFITLDNLVVFC